MDVWEVQYHAGNYLCLSLTAVGVENPFPEIMPSVRGLGFGGILCGLSKLAQAVCNAWEANADYTKQVRTDGHLKFKTIYYTVLATPFLVIGAAMMTFEMLKGEMSLTSPGLAVSLGALPPLREAYRYRQAQVRPTTGLYDPIPRRPPHRYNDPYYNASYYNPSYYRSYDSNYSRPYYG